MEQSTRLFSKVVLAAKYLNETKNDSERRYAFKMKLMREIIKMNDQPRESIQAVFYFIDYLLQLPEALSKELGETIRPLLRKEGTQMLQSEKWEKSPTLGEAFTIEWNDGKEKGRLEGIVEERRNLALALLRKDFSNETIAELTKLDLVEVNNLRKTLQ